MASINRSDVVVFLVEIILVIWTRMCAKYLSEIFLGQGKCLFKSAIMKSMLNVRSIILLKPRLLLLTMYYKI